jgi:hypothetical protein
MNRLFKALVFSIIFSGTAAIAQEHKHEEQKSEVKAPGAKAESKKCCEGMDKTGEMKHDMPMKGDMKAKMEKMKEMKEKMAEKMKGMEGMKMKAAKDGAKTTEANKDEHQH